ncbi:MAG: outer membrane protein assembly factor BamD [Gammaproteobacteria bacterium]|jgi:outer membrane protein assembly factor BamD|nr:outer membrane protein assembly factor BamD [Gammaproteobacteria bacterium]
MPAKNQPRSARILAALIAVALLSACASQRALEEAQQDPVRLYELGREALEGEHYETAIRHFENLSARFPFGEYAQQAQLHTAYAYYMFREPESAISAADLFIRNYPRHPDVDYAYYLRGLANFEQTRAFLDDVLKEDPAQRDPRSALESFRHFAELVQRFPDSPYAADAVQRMTHLRNYLARHELHVADYYMRRKAYVAAAGRARHVIENYAGAPAALSALDIMARAYDELGLPELAADARRVMAENATAGSDG